MHNLTAPAAAPRQLSLAVSRVVGQGFEHPLLGTYLADISVRVAKNPQTFQELCWIFTTKHRILEARNSQAKEALDRECDYLLFLDPDMDPNAEMNEPHYQPFLETGIQFLEGIREGKYGQPPESLGIIGAPALSGPPEYKCNVFVPDPKTGIRRVSQREAMERKPDIQRVSAIGTAVLLIPTEVFRRLPQPWFDDLYKGPAKDHVWTTQDTYFCQLCNQHGISVWCSWYAWAMHYKTVGIGRPDAALLAALEASNVKEEKPPCPVPETEAGTDALAGLVQAAGSDLAEPEGLPGDSWRADDLQAVGSGAGG